jgi:hypothetical protein
LDEEAIQGHFDEVEEALTRNIQPGDTTSELQWHDWRRYSFRQDSEMYPGGMTGAVT